MAGVLKYTGRLAFLGALTLSACATPPNDGQAKTLTMVETAVGLFHVDAQLGEDGPYRLLVDTGAQRSAIDHAVVQELAMPMEDITFDVHGLFSVEAIQGSPQISMRAGAFTNQQKLMTIDMRNSDDVAPADGILGIDALLSLQDQNRYLIFDFETPRIMARSMIGNPLRREIYSWHPLLSVRPEYSDFLIVDVSLGGVEGRAVIDSGLAVSVMNEAFSDALSVRGRNRIINLVDANGEIIAPLAAPSRPFEAMGLKWNRVQMLVYDAEAFEPLGLADGPAILLGADLLASLTLVIDTEWRKISAIPGEGNTFAWGFSVEHSGSRIY